MPVHLAMQVGPQDHVRGEVAAPVTLLEYGDFACAYCAQAFPVVMALLASYGPTLRFVFRHAPKTRFDPDAVRAAQAVEAAGAQGRFWEMHDLLFGVRPGLDLESLVEEARRLGLAEERFRADVVAQRFREKVRGMELSGARIVRGTPAFFLDGVRHEDTPDEERLGAAIAALLRRAT